MAKQGTLKGVQTKYKTNAVIDKVDWVFYSHSFVVSQLRLQITLIIQISFLTLNY